MKRTSCRPACDGEPCPPGQCVADPPTICPATLKGAVIRLKTGSTWRVVHGERMRYVLDAIRHAIKLERDWAYRNLSASLGRGLRCVAHVERVRS